MSHISYYLTLMLQFSQQSNEYIQSVARCLQMMLRVDEYRLAFVSVDGISTLVGILSAGVNFQVNHLTSMASSLG